MKNIILISLLLIILNCKTTSKKQEFSYEIKNIKDIDNKKYSNNKYILTSIGTYKYKLIDISIDTAIAKARIKLFKNIKNVFLKKIGFFLLNSGVQEEKFQEFINNISNDIANNCIYLTKTDSVYIDYDQKPNLVYVYEILNLKDIKNNMEKILKKYIDKYIKLKPNRQFDELIEFLNNLSKDDF